MRAFAVSVAALMRARERLDVVLRRLAPARVELLQHDLRGHGARDLAGRRAAHAVGDHEERPELARRGACAPRAGASRSSVLRSATTNESSLCSRVRPTSVLPKTWTMISPELGEPLAVTEARSPGGLVVEEWNLTGRSDRARGADYGRDDRNVTCVTGALERFARAAVTCSSRPCCSIAAVFR